MNKSVGDFADSDLSIQDCECQCVDSHMITDALSPSVICDASLNSVADARGKELFLNCSVFAEGLYLHRDLS
jgi:hypothetical protein